MWSLEGGGGGVSRQLGESLTMWSLEGGLFTHLREVDNVVVGRGGGGGIYAP